MEKYVIEKVIGEGTYGVVYRAIEKGTKEVVAIKKFKSVADEQLSKREIQACSMLNHPYIVSYRYSFRHEGLLHLVFDFVCDSMTKLLSRNRNGIPPQHARKYTYQLCQALQCCHSNHIIHRDVKPDNILIDEKGDMKLCDFGIARTIQFEGDPLTDYVATRWYRPPEQELRIDRYSFDADMWSVGCVLLELLTGRPLFPGNTQIEQLNLIQGLLGPLPAGLQSRLPRGVLQAVAPTKSLQDLLGNRSLPDGTLDFLASTLQLEPKNRLSAVGCLNHPFLRPLRDADLKERKRKQQQCKTATIEDDGIEEEIPGEKLTSVTRSEVQAEGKELSSTGTPSYKSGPRSFGFKVTADGLTTQKSRERHSKEDRAQCKSDNNTTEFDSDDIQEIIEMDECNTPHRTPVGSKHQGKHTLPAPLPSHPKSLRRRISSSAECGDDGHHDPLEHECYEDDFEEYHS